MIMKRRAHLDCNAVMGEVANRTHPLGRILMNGIGGKSSERKERDSSSCPISERKEGTQRGAKRREAPLRTRSPKRMTPPQGQGLEGKSPSLPLPKVS